jgi:ABC-type multidrug transport system fused ATPase/permease subunit
VLGGFERRRGAFVLVLIVIRGIMDTLGVASVMPFVAVASDPKLIATNYYLRTMYAWGGFASNNDFLVALCGAVFAVLIFSMVVGALANASVYRFAQVCSIQISSRLIASYLFRPYTWFLNHHTAELGKTLLYDVDRVVNLVLLHIMNLISKVVAAAFLLTLVVLVDPTVAAAAALLFGGLYALTFLLVRRRLVWLGQDMSRADDARFKLAQESLSGIRDVKVAGLESAFLERYRAIATRFAKRQASHQIIGDMPRFFMETVAFGGMLAVLLFLLVRRDGGLSAALPLIGVYAFAGYKLLPALQQIYHGLATIKFGTEALARVHKELSRTDLATAQPKAPAPGTSRITLADRLELRDVCFRYPGAAKYALDPSQYDRRVRGHDGRRQDNRRRPDPRFAEPGRR